MTRLSDNVNRTHITIINQGVDFIIDNLVEKLTVEMIADHCCFSRYYFNRLFRSITGENIYAFIKRLRLEAAAFKLIKFPNISITDIAAELGYSSSNFSVMFKSHYSISPSQFRANPKLPLNPAGKQMLQRILDLQKNKPKTLLRQMDKQVFFEEFPEIKLAYQRFNGNYRNLSPVWENFCDKMERSFPDAPIEFYGISYDDPLVAGEDRCQYDLCARVTDSMKCAGDNFKKIHSGLYLCYRFEGHVSELPRVFSDLFGVWMPHRGHIMGQGLCLERYHRTSVPGVFVVMDLCVPVLPSSRAQIQK